MLSRQTALGRSGSAPEHLARHAPRIARPAGIGEDATHDRLRFARRVDFGVVEEIDAGIVGGTHQAGRGRVVELERKRDPATERQRTDLQAGTS